MTVFTVLSLWQTLRW